MKRHTTIMMYQTTTNQTGAAIMTQNQPVQKQAWVLLLACSARQPELRQIAGNIPWNRLWFVAPTPFVGGVTFAHENRFSNVQVRWLSVRGLDFQIQPKVGGCWIMTQSRSKDSRQTTFPVRNNNYCNSVRTFPQTQPFAANSRQYVLRFRCSMRNRKLETNDKAKSGKTQWRMLASTKGSCMSLCLTDSCNYARILFTRMHLFPHQI